MKTILYITELEKVFQENANVQKAAQQKAYLKNKFAFYGLTSPQRRAVQKSFLAKQYLPTKDIAFQIGKELWGKPQREFHYFSQELIGKYHKQVAIEDIDFIEWMIINKSWWDTVDYIAVNLVGNYFTKFPDRRLLVVDKWLQSGNIWLQRSCLLFQLKYKFNTDTILLAYCIENLLGSKEFFINKAIGWCLRQYSRTNSAWVSSFVENHPQLSNLSRKEALRLLE